MKNSTSVRSYLAQNLRHAAKLSACVGSAIALSFTTTSQAFASGFADFLFVVDESGSMSGEHTWLGNMITDLEAALQSKGLGTGSEGNRYGLVGFGGLSYAGAPFARTIDTDLSTPGIQQFANSSLFGGATSQLQASGGYEDGYEAIETGLGTYAFRQNAAVNVVLITDEDRDYTNSGSNGFDFNSVLSALTGKNALLNAVVNQNFTDGNGSRAIGADGDGNAFVADGSGGYVKSTGAQTGYGFGTTKADYVDLAWATGTGNITGAGWDLNLLRAGGTTAQSFTAAFVDIKATEALNQVQSQQPSQDVPEPGMLLGLMGLGLTGAGLRRSRRA
ncbi:MAG: PEP-CTERM sorting domain-containing protein [Jaaginema sp. PMC 1079.18]|nr:PEP-CTERM sorting domain-containing protein [Jaaginema sp. PMC 1080.18]MEC4849558.1 PEP-CTERM sorting domain-containing protein [Jaaginema sp. PMC 1079.18]MEC4869000.1 PEP-CTERM sorting domain-containing protein [Jaaginema sp. PMC 1078.18]